MCRKSVVTVGEIIQTRLDKNGWDVYELSKQSGLYPDTLQRIIDGKDRIGEYEASQLAVALNICAEFWLALDEFNYRKLGKERFLRKSKKTGQAVFAFC